MNGAWPTDFVWHPQLVARVRVGVGIWLLTLTAVLYGSGHGGWWEGLLVATAALHFYLAFRLRRASNARRIRSTRDGRESQHVRKRGLGP
jgi:hypothetical protein